MPSPELYLIDGSAYIYRAYHAIRPLSTSRKAVSTRRAMKGAAASVSGTTAAQVPMDEPVMKRVNGMMATSRMMNGVERTAFTTPPTTR